ncbi:glycosyltransferase [Candidatus Nitrospira bockiana]
MNVLHISLTDGHDAGGAGIAMARLDRGLRERGIETRILCGERTTHSPHVAEIPRLWRIDGLLRRITEPLGLNDIHRVGTFWIPRHCFYRDADVLHIHGTHTGTLSYLALPKLTAGKPTVFTLHDMWAMTGHCAYSFDCERWRIGCGQCPDLASHPKVSRDATRLEWWLKQWTYGRSRLSIVTPSVWMKRLAEESMLKRFPVHVIPNGVDLDIFRPHDPVVSRRLLGLPADRIVLLFSARNLLDRRKGADLLLDALRRLPASLTRELILVTVGSQEWAFRDVGIDARHFGYVADDYLRAIIYSAADVYLFPTRADNAPLVVLESLACGTPVIAFDTGGLPELVRPGISGLLARADSAVDFCGRILQFVDGKSLRLAMRERARRLAVKEYSLEIHVRRHLALYRMLTGTEGAGPPSSEGEAAAERCPEEHDRASLSPTAPTGHGGERER